MLQSFGEHIKGWVAGVIIGLISVTFVIWGVQAYFESGNVQGTVLAKVNGTKITEKQVSAILRRLQYRQAKPLSIVEQKQLRQVILQNLIRQTALQKGVSKAGFRMSPLQINAVIMQMPELQVKGHFSSQRLQSLLYANGLTLSEFTENIGNNLLVNQVRAGFAGASFALPAEVKTMYQLSHQTRDISYIKLSSKAFLSSAKPTEKVVMAYYQQHQQKFATPEKVSVEYVQLSPQTIAKKVQISAGQVKTYYEENTANFATPKRWQIAEIRLPFAANATSKQINLTHSKMNNLLSELKQGKSFLALAKKYGSDAKLAQPHWVNPTDISSALMAPLNNLQPMQISDVLQTSDAFYIVRLVAVKPSKVKPFANVKVEIAKLLKQQKVETAFAKLSDQLSNLSYTNPDSLSSVSQATHLPILSTALFTRQGTSSGIAANAKVVSAAFSTDVLTQGNNSSPINLKDNSVVVLRVKQHLPSSLQPLSVVKAKIEQLLAQQTAGQQAAALANKIQIELAQGKDAANLAKREKLSYKTVKQLKRNSHQLPEALLSVAFNLPLAVHQPSAVVDLNEGNYAVVVLNSVHAVDYSKVSKKTRAALVKQLSAFQSALYFQLYEQGLQQKASIKHY